jgi:hypothetical protein
MRVRRTATVLGLSTGLLLVGGPAWADDVPPPTDDPSCSVVYPGDGGTASADPGGGEVTGEPTADPTDQPTDEPTVDPTVDPTDQPTDEPTVDPTVDPTDQATDEPTVDPTVDPTDQPTDEPTTDPGPVYVCMAADGVGSEFTGGSGTVEKAATPAALPFTGAPVAGTALLGLTLLVGGTAVVVGVRKPRRT